MNNTATVIVIIVLALCIFLAIRKIVRDKKKGIGSCGKKCSDCQNKCDNSKC